MATATTQFPVAAADVPTPAAPGDAGEEMLTLDAVPVYLDANNRVRVGNYPYVEAWTSTADGRVGAGGGGNRHHTGAGVALFTDGRNVDGVVCVGVLGWWPCALV